MKTKTKTRICFFFFFCHFAAAFLRILPPRFALKLRLKHTRESTRTPYPTPARKRNARAQVSQSFYEINAIISLISTQNFKFLFHTLRWVSNQLICTCFSRFTLLYSVSVIYIYIYDMQVVIRSGKFAQEKKKTERSRDVQRECNATSCQWGRRIVTDSGQARHVACSGQGQGRQGPRSGSA